MASEEKWEEDEEPNVLKRFLNKYFPPKKPKAKKEKKQKVDKENTNETQKIETSEPQEKTIKETPEPKQKKKNKPLFSLRPPRPKNVDPEEWEKESQVKKGFEPNLEKQLPVSMVIKRIVTSLLILANILGLVFAGMKNTYSTVILLLVTFILFDYLAITSSEKKEKWE